MRASNIEALFFVDTEVSVSDKKVVDIGAMSAQGDTFHSPSLRDLALFISKARFLCGHNVIHHDWKFLFGGKQTASFEAVDTLYLSPLLFPKRPYHKLLKDDKLQVEELNNPLNDCQKTQALLYDEINAFNALPTPIRNIYYALLHDKDEFRGFFNLIGFSAPETDVAQQISTFYADYLCVNKNIASLAERYPVELAYALALIGTSDFSSITPPWLLRNYPRIENIIQYLCNTPCKENCHYCQKQLDIHIGLQNIFGFSEFRTFDGEPMQERAVQSAINGESLLTIFPTGGGKSLTFQLPAVMSGRAVHGLTVVISPLQSLMKDQVDNLNERGIFEAVTINGLLDPLSRADAINRIANGTASILYISPEMLRSKTIERLLLSRNVVRFVIDEAHCFSAWGQDFRVDYLFIGDFIKKLQEKKNTALPIPVSCFTATAKQKVVTDICDYFKQKLNLDLKLFASASSRKNLKYSVIYAETEDEKYNLLRNIVIGHNCPTIVYVSRTRRTFDLAKKLTSNGIPSLPYNGKMESADKILNQNAFINNEVQLIVATSAFGMGVDKKDVGLVIHYEISDSLENYVQEAGRAGRNPELDAKCYVLYSDKDLDKHFILLNQTKLSLSEIQQVWSAIKKFTRQRKTISCSALEIAREAGWDDNVTDIETRVRAAISALETAGYISRGNNVPHIFATGIMVKNLEEARVRITNSDLFDEDSRQNSIRIIKSLISQRYIKRGEDSDAESRVDYLADILGMTKEAVINAVNRMRQSGILADSQDMSAYIDKGDTEKRSSKIFSRFATLEKFLLDEISDEGLEMPYKALNEKAINAGITDSSVKSIRTLLYFLTVKGFIKKKENAENGLVSLILAQNRELTMLKYDRRIDICNFLIEEFFKINSKKNEDQKEQPILFSVTELLRKYKTEKAASLFTQQFNVKLDDIEDALLYLSKIGALKLDGGFMVVYNAMEIKRLSDQKLRYKIEDYRLLDEFYKQKIRQIHIVGEYANLMVRDYEAALQYVQDYFQMEFQEFIKKYFEGSRAKEIEKNITPAKYQQLFGELSDIQRKIINDNQSKYIVVAAGPGSGKTKVLAHKLASLLLMEDVKHDQLLMLTFSRAAATEFKKRLISLIGNAAHFVEIKTFHSYCFDLIGKVGNIEEAQDVVERATKMIEQGEVEQGRINKAVLVIDEAQDMDKAEFALVRALMNNNEEMRVIAVGDDDQNIYQFRGSSSEHLQSLLTENQAKLYEMTENYRSVKQVVDLANALASRIQNRMKQTPIIPIRQDSGIVFVREYASKNMEESLVSQLRANYHGETTCVMTSTNEEAQQLVFLLNHYGLNAKLIQSMDGFRFYDLMEIRYFLQQLKQNPPTPKIAPEMWERAKANTLSQYGNSETGDILRAFFTEFESINKDLYRSDLEEFIYESRVEDFNSYGGQFIYVSTIHKTKGREFDSVYMMLTKEFGTDSNELRKLYVGLTRAKCNLNIHTCTNIFAPYRNLCTEYFMDNQCYSEPKEIMMQLSHKGVYLNFFKGKKREILKLRSGDELFLDNLVFKTQSGLEVASLSKEMATKIADAQQKGYTFSRAKVRYIVAWRGKDDTEASAVILPDIWMKRK